MRARSAASDPRPRCSVKVHEDGHDGADPGPNPVVRALEELGVLAAAAAEWRCREGPGTGSGSPMSPITGHHAIFKAGNHRQPRRRPGIGSPICNAGTSRRGKQLVKAVNGRGNAGCRHPIGSPLPRKGLLHREHWRKARDDRPQLAAAGRGEWRRDQPGLPLDGELLHGDRLALASPP